MTTLFGIAFLLAILALIEGICICTKRKLHNQKRPASCYVLLSALELRPDWKAELNHLFSDLQWQVSLQTAEIFLLLPEEPTLQSEEILGKRKSLHSGYGTGNGTKGPEGDLQYRHPSY